MQCYSDCQLQTRHTDQQIQADNVKGTDYCLATAQWDMVEPILFLTFSLLFHIFEHGTHIVNKIETES